MRRTLKYSFAKHEDLRWEVQMLGADFEARRENKLGGRKLTMRQHYWNTIQRVMEYIGLPTEVWHREGCTRLWPIRLWPNN